MQSGWNSNKGTGKGQGKGGRSYNSGCFTCGSKDHWANKCPQNSKNQNQGSRNKGQNNSGGKTKKSNKQKQRKAYRARVQMRNKLYKQLNGES